MQLTGPQIQSLIDAIGNAFRYNELASCIDIKMRRKLDHIVAVPQRMPNLIYELLDTANREGWVEQLLEALTTCNPQRELHDAIKKCLFTTPSAARFLDGETYLVLANFIQRSLSIEEFRALVGELGHEIEVVVTGRTDAEAIFAMLFEAVQSGFIDQLLQKLALRREETIGVFAAALLAGDDQRIEAMKHQVPDRNAGPWRAFVSRPEVVNREALKSLPNALVDPAEWLEAMNRVSRWICRVEVAEKEARSVFGTGFLVAPDLVLTSGNCIRAINPSDIGQSVCRFDFRSLSNGTGLTQGAVIPFAADWLVDSSDTEELKERTVDSARSRLNYAVIRLVRPIGDEPVDGDRGRRGWFSLSPRSPDLSIADRILVLSHPEGGPLKLSIGEILGWDASGTRLVHTSMTLPGSSGAPCLNSNFELVGLQEARLEEQRRLAVSMDSVVQRMREGLRARGIELFWAPAPQG